MRLPLLLTLLFTSTAAALPICEYGSIPTPRSSLHDWRTTLLDTTYYLPETYAPTDLVQIGFDGTDNAETMYTIRAVMKADLQAFMAAAREAGVPLAIQSAYRSYDYQVNTFQYWVDTLGREEALLTSARAGHSEHQLGTVVDLRSLDGPPAWDLHDWATTPAGAWAMEHAATYGFVLSYPANQSAITCYSYEPWHYRYVGPEMAADVQRSGLTLREYLWRIHSQAGEV